MGTLAPAVANASRISLGVGCFGSPIDRLIGDSAALGVTPAKRARSRSNGYGCRRERRGIQGKAKKVDAAAAPFRAARHYSEASGATPPAQKSMPNARQTL